MVDADQSVHTFEPRFDIDGVRRFVLRWNSTNFDAALLNCKMPEQLLDVATDLNIAFDGLSVKYAGAAPGVTLECSVVNGKIGALGYSTNVLLHTTVAATETIIVPLYQMPFIWTPDASTISALVAFLVTGYAATDDAYIRLWGTIRSTQKEPMPGEQTPPQPVSVEQVNVWPWRK